MWKLLFAILAAIWGLSAFGCAMPMTPYEPAFEAKYSPFWGASVKSSRDDKGKASGKYNKATGDFEFDVEIEANASSVNASQVALMEAYRAQMVEFNEQLKTHGANLDMLAGRLNELAGIAAGVLNVQVDKDGVKAGNQLAPKPEPAPPAPPPPQAEKIGIEAFDATSAYGGNA